VDYPKSVPGIGLVNGKFVDEDTAAGTQGSLIPAAWGNAVTAELLTVIEASGQRPAEDDNTQLVPAIQRISASQAGHGQCRLSVINPSVLRLLPLNGNKLVVGGATSRIPVGGVSIHNEGLRASTGYYVYAFLRSGELALTLSTTGHTVHTNGVQVKSDDAGCTLVGWTRTNAASQFAADNGGFISTMNWFNRRYRSVVVSSSVDLSFTNITIRELSSSLRSTAPVWANEYCIVGINGNFLNHSAGGGVNIQIYSGDQARGAAMSSNLSSNVLCPFNTQTYVVAPSDGLINCQLYGFVGSGVGRVSSGVQLMLTLWC